MSPTPIEHDLAKKRGSARICDAAHSRVLREVSTRLRTTIRATDAVGRFGGEEFLVVMPECSLATGAAGSKRIRHRSDEVALDTTIRAGRPRPVSR
jgi:diguanylate cyclase (GGDEF)-like protein